MAQETKSSQQQSSAAGRVERVTNILKSRLEDEAMVLDVLLAEATRSRPHPELWTQLHEAAVRDDMLPELAFAYEQMARGKKLKASPPAVQAEILMHAASFFVDVFGDNDGAMEFLERVLAINPAHPDAFTQLERLLIAAQSWIALSDLYTKAAALREEPKEKIALFRRAAELIDRLPGEVERAISIYEQILQIDPGQKRFRRTLEARYLLAGRTQDAANFLEQVLVGQPPPDDDEAFAMRTRLMVLYAGELGEMEKSLPHVEELLKRDPAHEQARLIAQRLLENGGSPAFPGIAGRAATLLADVYERLGNTQEAAGMLAVQLEHLTGAQRTEAQRRLAILRQDGLGDGAGALPLLEAVVLADPGDDEVRHRFRGVSAALDRRLDAARTLARAAGITKDIGLRARIGAELGEILVEAGDVKRARAVFQEVIDRGGDDRAVLMAARELSSLYGLTHEHKALAVVLELLSRTEPDPAARLAATERLAKLYQSDLNDLAGAANAWRMLLGSALNDEAISALEGLYDKLGAKDDLAELLERRASATSGPAARMPAFRAAALRAPTMDPRQAVDLWKAFIATYGPARDVHSQVIPLLERERRWDDLATTLAQEAALSPQSERSGLLARVGELRHRHLSDPAGAIECYRDVLRADPKNAACRQGLEELLATGEHRIPAADVLEPIYRAEGNAADVVRLLEARAELSPELAERLTAYEQVVALVERELSDPKRALELAGRALREAAGAGDTKRVASWLDRVEKLAVGARDPAKRASILARALGDRPVDSRAMARLARVTGEALEAKGDVDRALVAYKRALAFEPSPELEKRAKKLALEQKSPEERMALHRAALEQTTDPKRRRELLHAIAGVQRNDLGDMAAAVDTWRQIIGEDPTDLQAYEALAEGLVSAGDEEGAYEVERRLAILRQDTARDLVGALPLLEKLVLLRPGDAEVRRRHRAAAAALNRRLDTVRVLAKAADSAGDLALRGQIGCELADTLVEAGDPKRARVVYQEVVEAGGDDGAVLMAARALATLYAKAREQEPLAETLALLARIEPEPAPRWAAMERLVKLSPDRAQALAAWRGFLARTGPSREVHARLLPLLEAEGQWEEVANVLAADAELAPEPERSRLLARLAELRLKRLGDADAALAAHRQVLAAEPQDAATRTAVEGLVAAGPNRIAAADLLEPIARAEGNTRALAKVLLARAEEGPDAVTRVAAMEEVVGLLQPDQALELCVRALRDGAGNPAVWLDRAEALAARSDPARRAAALGAALGDRPIRTRELARLARLAGEAYEAAGDVERALALYHRALASQPASTELKVRVYSLMMKKAEETLGDRAMAVAHVSKHVLAVSPDQMDAAFAIALLLPEIGNLEGTLAALTSLRDRSEGAVRTALELISAELLLDRLHRPDEALDILDRVLLESPNDPATLPILERALSRPASRARATAMLERASDAAEDPARALAVIERLIAAPAVSELGRAPETGDPRTARRAWFEALLDRYAARPDVALGIAVRAVAELPDEESLWDRAERLARSLERPDPVVATYTRLLGLGGTPAEGGGTASPALEGPVLQRIGRRAVEFEQEWFEDGDRVVVLLHQLLPLDREWAFDRLKLALSSSGRWPELFELYDQTVQQAPDDAARIKLLEEAAQVAKDFANDAERAITYLELIAAVRRGDGRVDAALERLYERKGHSRQLIDLLSARLPSAGETQEAQQVPEGNDAQLLRARIAGLWLDAGEETAAFKLIDQMLQVEPSRTEAFQLLERIVLQGATPEGAPTEEIPGVSKRLSLELLQRGAALLKERYTAENRTVDLVRVVSVELDTATSDAERIRVHRELVLLKLELGDDKGAFEDVASLVALEPHLAAHRDKLAELADRLGLHSRLAEVLVAAAARCADTRPLTAALTHEAAVVHRDRLQDPVRAIELFTRVLELAQEDPAMVLSTARELEPLLSSLGRDLERCSVLETIALLEREPPARRAAFGEVARIAGDVLKDEGRAINAWRARLLDDASDREALDGLAMVLERAERWRELIDVLDRRATVAVDTDPSRAKRDRVWIAKIFLERLASIPDGIDAWKRVRALFGPDEENFGALAGLLEGESRWQDLAELLAEEANASRQTERKVSLYRRLGDLQREKIGAVGPAAKGYREAVALDPRDAGARAGLLAIVDLTEVRGDVVDALSRAYVETGDWEQAAELSSALAAGEDVPSSIARKFWWGVALYYRDDRGDPDAAEWALRRALSHDESNAEILTSLAAVQRRTPGRPLVDTLVRLSDVKGGDLDLLREAAEVGIRALGDRKVGSANCEKLLDLAVARWTATSKRDGGKKKRLTDVTDDPRSPRAIANWALDELTRMGTEDGDFPRVVELYLRGAELPFDRAQTRKMRRDAAVMSADRLADADGAIRIYRNLFDEDPADEIAAQSVETFAALLERAGLSADVVAFWEQQARSATDAADKARAADLWARAAELSEQRLSDVERAIADHRHGAALGGVTSLEALARIHTSRQEHRAAAEALEQLCERSSPAAIADATLRLAEAYVAASERETARARLERAIATIEDSRALRTRLAELYREDESWDPLAALFTDDAERAGAPAERLTYLRDAAGLHLFKRRDATAAIPLLGQALALAPDDALLGLTLGEALCAVGRHDEAVRVLGAHIERYGSRKPKDRALSHYALARAAEAAGDRGRSLKELELAAKIDSTHSGILHALGRAATQQGELARAMRAYQALLLVRQPQEDGPTQQAYQALLDLRRKEGEVREGDLTRAELLLELSDIAERQNDPVRAAEFRESAIEAGRESPRDAERLRRALAARGKEDLLSRPGASVPPPPPK